MIESILIPIISIGGLSLVFGALLGFSAKKFAVKTDPNIERIHDVLPGTNCGGCGFAGCAMFAQAVANNKAAYNACPPGGNDTAAKIAQTMGIDPVASGRKVAFIKCNGLDDNVSSNYIYDGPKSCVAASQLATGGNKSCIYGCIGLESCKNACPFNAVKIVGSIAIIDPKKCTACGKCIAACPKNLIEIVQDKSKVRVLCNSSDIGRITRKNCRAGCIGCTVCQKLCPEGAISLENNKAKIDYEKCTLCMACVQKCPTKSIKVMS